jgi:hypothetical protein
MQKRTRIIRDFILKNVKSHPMDIARFAASNFDISVQSILRHINNLIGLGLISSSGKTLGRRYSLAKHIYTYAYQNDGSISEDLIWKDDISKYFSSFTENVRRIWAYCFAEIFNNAIDHSAGTNINVVVEQDIEETVLKIRDNGIGIFNKIRDFMHLPDNREVVIELAKGKFTTDKERHTGEGLFFTSRMLDKFAILSYGASWLHDFNKSDWIFDENNDTEYKGTLVIMTLSNHSDRKIVDVFDKYGNPDFDTTIIPVVLMSGGENGLVSRSQARRLVARIDRFKNVFFDFKGIDSIGQAFADELFRVFRNENQSVNIHVNNAAPQVQSMITRAENNASNRQ